MSWPRDALLPTHEGMLCCGCGKPPSHPWDLEGETAGVFRDEDGVWKFICYPCWCVENYGSASPYGGLAGPMVAKPGDLDPGKPSH